MQGSPEQPPPPEEGVQPAPPTPGEDVLPFPPIEQLPGVEQPPGQVGPGLLPITGGELVTATLMGALLVAVGSLVLRRASRRG